MKTGKIRFAATFGLSANLLISSVALTSVSGLALGQAKADDAVTINTDVLDELDRHLVRSRLLFPGPKAPESRLILRPPSERATDDSLSSASGSASGVIRLTPPPGMATAPVLTPPKPRPSAARTARPATAPPRDITAAPVDPVEETAPPVPAEQAPMSDAAQPPIDMSAVPEPPEPITAPEPTPEPDVPEPVVAESVVPEPVVAEPDPSTPTTPVGPEPALVEDILPAEQTGPEPAQTPPSPKPAPEESFDVASLPAAEAPFDPAQPVSVPYGKNERTVPMAAQGDLNALAAYLKRTPGPTLSLRAYAGSEDSDSSTARRLSLSRAIAVRAYLVEQGVRGARIEVIALGDQYAAGTRPNRVDASLSGE